MALNKDTRFTLMAFPQKVDAQGFLHLNFLFIPRNFSPLEHVNTIYNPSNKATAFIKARPNFIARIVNNPDDFPGGTSNIGSSSSLALNYSSTIENIYQILKNAKDDNGKPLYFDIEESYSQAAEHRGPKAVDANQAIKKYLPLSYRQAFNFNGARTKNAVTDDSYSCAMRAREKPKKINIDNKVSWGKVFAHLLRQPTLAEKAGLLYKDIKIKLNANDFKNGGWLYLDLEEGDYFSEQQKSKLSGNDVFIKSYAARIPALTWNSNKVSATNLFAAVLFPVMKKDENPVGNFDDSFIESAIYMDGFAKIVHANQPASQNLLEEEANGMPPQREIGIRLGWDDEQILIWYLRQLAKDPSVDDGSDRLDNPIGISGYHIDVKTINGARITTEWESLNSVRSKGNMILGEEQQSVNLGTYNGELPFQVYPIKEEGEESSGNYWLPMYFANWNSYSMVLPDKTASDLYQNHHTLENAVSISETYQPASQINQLLYGNTYEFRIRLSDLTGGGPSTEENPTKKGISETAKIHFKRYVAPHSLRFKNDSEINISGEETSFDGERLIIQRPILGYPEVVYTGKYQALGQDPIALLHASIQKQLLEIVDENKARVVIGLEDPDVTKVEIKVEVETLMMDNLASETGQENYIPLYTTFRNFEDDFKAELNLDFKYKDFPVLDFYELYSNFESEINTDKTAIILPTNRNLRVSIRAVGNGDSNYWGAINEKNTKFDSRYGKQITLKMRKNNQSEKNLIKGILDPRLIQGIFLQPDPITLPDNTISTQSQLGNIPSILDRLAAQLNVSAGYDPNKLVLTAKKGERVQFWCSNHIRHTLSPDNSSITFSGKNELTNKWLVITNFYIDRDWTWDGLEKLAFKMERKISFSNHPTELEARKEFLKSKIYTALDELSIERTASFQSIQEGEDQKIHRSYTRIIIIDAIDSVPPPSQKPDTILVQYMITPVLKSSIEILDSPLETEPLLLPVAVQPHQIPRVIGSGIAFSPYIANEKYSSTESRKRFLWLEFNEAPEDDRDSLFTRQLFYAPDQLLSNNHPSLFKDVEKEEPPLSLDPEYIRTIIPTTGKDRSGLSAMQQMIKSKDKDRHIYILPLPDGLHGQSPELFGFHTYEFRFGHTDRIWSTAQARFGRRLKLTGLQHPAPTLFCSVQRYQDKIQIQAPYAIAVANGKDVTSKPPRTQIWCLLYAQVRQADGKSFRNILIGEQKLIQIPMNSTTNNSSERYFEQLRSGLQPMAQTDFPITNIHNNLRALGLPEDAPLSVLCVEFFGNITNITQHINGLLYNENIDETIKILEKVDGNPGVTTVIKQCHLDDKETDEKVSFPTSRDLGRFRILRTSPLTEVPSSCCLDC